MGIRAHIPNALTCGNLVCGCVGLVELGAGRTGVAVALMAVAAVLDFADGLVARLLGVSSPIGKELDSLADLVTFGVLPAGFYFVLLRAVYPADAFALGPLSLGWPHLAGLVAVFSALRLARFNVDERQVSGFIGLPTPANALLAASLLLMAPDTPLLRSGPVLLGLVVLSAGLLVAPLPLFAFKFKNLSLRDNWARYALIFLTVLLVGWLSYRAVPFVLAAYVLFSLIFNRTSR